MFLNLAHPREAKWFFSNCSLGSGEHNESYLPKPVLTEKLANLVFVTFSVCMFFGSILEKNELDRASRNQQTEMQNDRSEPNSPSQGRNRRPQGIITLIEHQRLNRPNSKRQCHHWTTPEYHTPTQHIQHAAVSAHPRVPTSTRDKQNQTQRAINGPIDCNGRY